MLAYNLYNPMIVDALSINFIYLMIFGRFPQAQTKHFPLIRISTKLTDYHLFQL